MRIVGGRLRGRTLTAPKSRAIRPTTDRLRQALFNVLAHAYGDPISGARVLDLFAGTGALGLEALSRGAAFALFAPAGTPDAIIRRLNAATSDALDNLPLARRMEELGLTVPPPERRSPEHLGKLLRMEIAKWAPPIKASGFSAD